MTEYRICSTMPGNFLCVSEDLDGVTLEAPELFVVVELVLGFYSFG